MITDTDLKVILASIALSGYSEVTVTREEIEDEVWRDLVVKSHYNPDDRGITVTLGFKQPHLQYAVDRLKQLPTELEVIEIPPFLYIPKHLASK